MAKKREKKEKPLPTSRKRMTARSNKRWSQMHKELDSLVKSILGIDGGLTMDQLYTAVRAAKGKRATQYLRLNDLSNLIRPLGYEASLPVGVFWWNWQPYGTEMISRRAS